MLLSQFQGLFIAAARLPVEISTMVGHCCYTHAILVLHGSSRRHHMVCIRRAATLYRLPTVFLALRACCHGQITAPFLVSTQAEDSQCNTCSCDGITT